MVKQSVAYPYNGTLFNFKRKEILTYGYNVDEP